MLFGQTDQLHRKDGCSLPVSIECTSWQRASVSASLTLEAACVIPLFFCAVLALLYLADVSALQVRLLNGIRETGRSMAIAAAVREFGEEESMGMAGTIVSTATASHSIRKCTKNTVYNVLDGDISLIGSSFLEDEMIDLKVSGKLKLPVPFLNLKSIRFWQRGYIRAWTGRCPDDTSGTGEGNSTKETVYVTVSGSVYHKDLSCGHLKLSIRQVSQAEVKNLRSKDGSKYYACSCYKKNASGSNDPGGRNVKALHKMWRVKKW